MGEIANVFENEVLIERFQKLAPANIKLDAEKTFAIQLLNNNEYLSKAASGAPNSLLAAISNVAAIGLSLNPAKRQAYLIVRNVKVGDGKWERRVFLEPSYMGLCDIATQSGMEWVQAEIVRDKDTFIYKGIGEKPVHDIQAFRDRGEIIGVYCIAKTKNGDYLTNMMDMEKITSIRDRSEAWKSTKSGPWKTDFEQMAKKAVIRQAFNTWPKVGMERFEQAVHLSNENEGFEKIETQPELRDFTTDQKEFFDKLISDSDAIGMHLFIKTIPEATFINLYHSFPKGSKGKYQGIVDSLNDKGRSLIEDYVLSIEDLVSRNDDAGLREAIEELGINEFHSIEDRFSEETVLICKEIITSVE